jgi:hypothetical protein
VERGEGRGGEGGEEDEESTHTAASHDKKVRKCLDLKNQLSHDKDSSREGVL